MKNCVMALVILFCLNLLAGCGFSPPGNKFAEWGHANKVSWGSRKGSRIAWAGGGGGGKGKSAGSPKKKGGGGGGGGKAGSKFRWAKGGKKGKSDFKIPKTRDWSKENRFGYERSNKDLLGGGGNKQNSSTKYNNFIEKGTGGIGKKAGKGSKSGKGAKGSKSGKGAKGSKSGKGRKGGKGSKGG